MTAAPIIVEHTTTRQQYRVTPEVRRVAYHRELCYRFENGVVLSATELWRHYTQVARMREEQTK